MTCRNACDVIRVLSKMGLLLLNAFAVTDASIALHK